MRKDTNSTVFILRFLAGLALSPLLTASLILAPAFIPNPGSWVLMIAYPIVLLISYIVSLCLGLPIVLILDAKQKCTFTNLAISGFVLGFITAIIAPVFITSGTAYTHYDSLAKIIELILLASWYGVCAAAGATLFALLSGITHRYNKAFKRDSRKSVASPLT